MEELKRCIENMKRDKISLRTIIKIVKELHKGINI